MESWDFVSQPKSPASAGCGCSALQLGRPLATCRSASRALLCHAPWDPCPAHCPLGGAVITGGINPGFLFVFAGRPLLMISAFLAFQPAAA